MKLRNSVIPARFSVQRNGGKHSGMTLLSGILVVFSVLSGCAPSQPTALLTGQTLEGAPICLDNRDNIPAIVRKFFNSRDLTTEEGKIDYLIERVRNSKLVLIRNKVEYDSASSASFLRWKLNRLQKKGTKIETAQEFVSLVTSGSKVSGEPYSITLQDGSRHNLQSILQNELDALIYCLKQFSTEEKTKTDVKSKIAGQTQANEQA